MNEQLSILDKQREKFKHDKEKRKRAWENGFQKWSDGQVDNDCSPLGKCGYGAICDYCEDNSYGRPCVRALDKMLRETGEHIDYDRMTYEEVWEGARAC